MNEDTYRSEERRGPLRYLSMLKRLHSNGESVRLMLFLDIAREVQRLWNEEKAVVYMLAFDTSKKTGC